MPVSKKGRFVSVSLEKDFVVTRTEVCQRFIGSPSTSRTPVACAVLLALASVVGPTTAHAQFAPPRTGQQRGATVGGLAGAAIGAVIGDHNDEAGAGAAIGAAIGAVTGGVLGNASDKERVYGIQQRRAVPSGYSNVYRGGVSRPASVPVGVPVGRVASVVTPAPVPQTTVSPFDVVNMSRSGLSDNIIISQLRNRGLSQTLSVSDIISLHNSGVSEAVITTMQAMPVSRSATQVQTVASPPVYIEPQPPVIVREHVVVPHPHPGYPRRTRSVRYGF